MANTLLREKHVSGAPTHGGRFASRGRSEASVQLADEDLSGAEILEVSRRLTAQYTSRYPFLYQDAAEREDIAQGAALSVWQSKLRNSEATITAPLINTAVRALTSRRMNPTMRHEDARALTILKQQVADMEQDEGRHLSGREISALATEIRDNWENKRHRPSPAFHQEKKVVALSDYDLSSITAAAQEPSNESAQVRLAADQVEDAQDAEGPDAKRELADVKRHARRNLWNTLHDGSEVPRVQKGSLPASRGTQYRKAVPDARVASQQFLDGELGHESERALFAPFGSLNSEGKRQVALSLLRRRDYAHDLWKSAVESATKGDA